jgi:hypothetical protein
VDRELLNPIMVQGEVTEISCLAHGITDRKDAQKKLLKASRKRSAVEGSAPTG